MEATSPTDDLRATFDRYTADSDRYYGELREIADELDRFVERTNLRCALNGRESKYAADAQASAVYFRGVVDRYWATRDEIQDEITKEME